MKLYDIKEQSITINNEFVTGWAPDTKLEFHSRCGGEVQFVLNLLCNSPIFEKVKMIAGSRYIVSTNLACAAAKFENIRLELQPFSIQFTEDCPTVKLIFRGRPV
jgi:hypothetical protein